MSNPTTGAVQYLLTGSGYNVPLGGVTGGTRYAPLVTAEEELVGGTSIHRVQFQHPRFSVDLLPVDGTMIGTTAGGSPLVRSSFPVGLPAATYCEIGDDESGQRGASWFANTWRLECEAGGVLRLTGLEMWSSVKPTPTSGGGYYTPAKTLFNWTRGVVTVGGLDFGARSISFNGNNNLIWVPVLDSKTAGARAYPYGIAAGPEVIDVECVFYVDPKHDIDGDALDNATIALAVTNSANSPVAKTFTATAADVMSWESRLVNARTLKEYTVRYQLTQNSGLFVIS
jgi:hypothetical protein